MSESNTLLPAHVGFIMDGNRRWAKANGRPTLEGHYMGQKALREAVYHAVKCGVRYISAYAFSTENWSRTKKEVGYLMRQVTAAFLEYGNELVENDIRVVILGSPDNLPQTVQDSFREMERRTAHGKRATLAICFNYGGQTEITDAVKQLIDDKVPAAEVTPAMIADRLYHPEIPPLDLVIRTSGEKRLSGFMLWRSAYSEFIFRDENWPDFSVDSLDECLLEYSQRQRRFGG